MIPSGSRRDSRAGRVVAVLLLATTLAGGCSVRRMAVRSLANALTDGASSWASDDDPELIRDATPFALKTMEGLLAEDPEHKGLLLATSSGFTQYAYAFVASEADYVEATDLARAKELRARARRLYRRALAYGRRGLAVGRPGFDDLLSRDPEGALAMVDRRDVPQLYWTAAAWGALIGLSKDDGSVTADLPVVGAMLQRALALDEGFAAGAAHDLLIAYEGGRPAAGGGSMERARDHLERALALSRGLRAAPLVTFAETVSVARQDRAEFSALLQQALAVDVDAAPQYRLANLVAQRRARWLLDRTDELFIE